MAHLVCVKILMLAQIDFFPFLRSLEKKLSFRLLRHDIFADERSLASMDLKASARVFDGEGIMELRQKAAPEPDSTHHGVFETASSKPLPTR
jgi:hypothetical protein